MQVCMSRPGQPPPPPRSDVSVQASWTRTWGTRSAAEGNLSRELPGRHNFMTQQSWIFALQLGFGVLTHPKPWTLCLENLRMEMTLEDGLVKSPNFLEYWIFQRANNWCPFLCVIPEQC